ncbi:MULTISPECIES: hypothetical protein [Sphingobacterium]|nr:MULTISPECIES: hypothetical protein [Sphingobacterium]
MHDFYKGSGRGKRRNWIANRPEESPVFNGRIRVSLSFAGDIN